MLAVVSHTYGISPQEVTGWDQSFFIAMFEAANRLRDEERVWLEGTLSKTAALASSATGRTPTTSTSI
jgi:hypothetical protein